MIQSQERKKERKRERKMRKFNSYRSYSSYKKNHVSVPRIGSDDGYDYQKDNRNGEVDDYVKFVEQWRKDQAKSPKSGD